MPSTVLYKLRFKLLEIITTKSFTNYFTTKSFTNYFTTKSIKNDWKNTKLVGEGPVASKSLGQCDGEKGSSSSSSPTMMIMMMMMISLILGYI